MDRDLNIRDDVLEELEFEPRVEAENIGVAVSDGVVTLSGHVPNYAQKLAAESAAKRVKGVRAVAIDIEVRLPFDGKHDDDEIAKRAANVLTWSVEAPKEGVKVSVENGWVTLKGQVTWAYQRGEAERSVRQLAGVRGVSNLIAIQPRLKSTDIQSQLKRAFHRSAELEAGRINVGVEGGRVTLTGKVSNWSDRRVAETAAWSVPGVTEVVDRLTL